MALLGVSWRLVVPLLHLLFHVCRLGQCGATKRDFIHLLLLVMFFFRNFVREINSGPFLCGSFVDMWNAGLWVCFYWQVQLIIRK